MNSHVTTSETSKEHVITICIPTAKQSLINKFDEIATKSGVDRATLLWRCIEDAIFDWQTAETIITNAHVGFWLSHAPDAAGKATAISVTEVLDRSEGNGRTFYRYKKGDAKSRQRAMSAAKQDGDYYAKAFGFGNFNYKELEGAELEEALNPTPVVVANENRAHNETKPD